ncbi:jg12981 [Pararge aegeria aegeria]|uniref:Jg12981 protein n=1 Tax=Pararge aegeria aegeria TaxID=348720 RepID=A0A8S4RXF9_9NEOP|nr:jg12981 [Pararge aegeria aegeria]
MRGADGGGERRGGAGDERPSAKLLYNVNLLDSSLWIESAGCGGRCASESKRHRTSRAEGACTARRPASKR